MGVVVTKENRVRVSVYGMLPADSPLLVPVPTVSGKKPERLHVLAARGLEELSAAARFHLSSSVPGGLLVASGWRGPRWSSVVEYEKAMIKRYGSVEKGHKFTGFESPHETGLAVDFGCGGLEPVSATIEKQKQTTLYRWLCENAHDYGWTPYLLEPWHWEFNVPLTDYKAGLAPHEREVCEAVGDPNWDTGEVCA